MLNLLKKYKIIIELVSIISGVLFGMHQIYSINNSIKRTEKLETFKIIEDIYFHNFSGTAEKEKIDYLLYQTNFVDFLNQVNTCVKTESCNRSVVLKYLCNSERLSSQFEFTLEFSSVIDQLSTVLGPPKKNVDSLERHKEVISILNELFEVNIQNQKSGNIIENCKNLQPKKPKR